MATTTTKREIVFIDRGVDDLDTLLAGIRPDVEPILLSNDEPAPRQMARAVQAREGLEAIHVIAHGRPGEVSFGAGALTLRLIDDDDAADLADVGRVLGEDGQLLFWSCHTGHGASGSAFVAALGHAIGRGVAAAIDLVGAAALGGRWEIEA